MRLQLSILLALLCTSSCSKPLPEYWVAGLSLPPGSTIVNRQELSGDASFSGIPGTNTKVQKTLNVIFTNPAGWDSVTAHIDGILRPQGYGESTADAAAAGENISPVPGVDAATMIRMYHKDGAEFSVWLINMNSMAAAGGRQMPAGMGDYSLHVAQVK
jgi:hypothetical protein